MNERDIAETAYKNGYAAGQRDARKHGRWLDGNSRQPCSVCRYRGMKSWHFCPNCGADMRLSVVFDETMSAIKKPEFYLGGDNYET